MLRKLLARADVLIENYRAGVMERLGFGPDVLAAANEKLIHCSITGFGATGPYSGRPAYDSVGLALSRHRKPAARPGSAAGLRAHHSRQRHGHGRLHGILGALYERERTGKGRRVEVNMLEAAISFIPDPFANHTRMGIANDPLTRVASSHSFAFRCGTASCSPSICRRSRSSGRDFSPRWSAPTCSVMRALRTARRGSGTTPS